MLRPAASCGARRWGCQHFAQPSTTNASPLWGYKKSPSTNPHINKFSNHQIIPPSAGAPRSSAAKAGEAREANLFAPHPPFGYLLLKEKDNSNLNY